MLFVERYWLTALFDDLCSRDTGHCDSRRFVGSEVLNVIRNSEESSLRLVPGKMVSVETVLEA